MSCTGVCRFLAGSSDSDSENDRRVVRSAKDRRFDELNGSCDELRVRPLLIGQFCCYLKHAPMAAKISSVIS